NAGSYSFSSLAAGTYTVREVVPAGYTCSLPTAANNCEYSVTGSTGNASNNNFGNWRPATISGTKFEDLNANNVKDAGDTTGVGGVTIYIDANNNATFDDPISTTTAANGTYSLTGLKPGTYTVRE